MFPNKRRRDLEALAHDLVNCLRSRREAAKRALIAEGLPGARLAARLAHRSRSHVALGSIADVLGEAGDAWSLITLRKMLNNRHVVVRRRAANAIQRIAERHAAAELPSSLLLRWQLAAALPKLEQLCSRETVPGPYREIVEEVRRSVDTPPEEPEAAPSLPIPARAPRPDRRHLPIPSEEEE